MRGTTLVAMAILGMTAFSGCLGFGGDAEDDHSHGDHCDEHEGAAHAECHDDPSDGNNTDDNGTLVPNVAPVANLTMTDADGNILGNSTAIMAGQTITFSANGSADADGSIELAALTVYDKNGTRTISLIQDGRLVDVTLKFDVHGYVVASLRVLDDDGASASAAGQTWVNAPQSSSGSDTLVAPPDQVLGDCSGPGEGLNALLIDQYYSSKPTFQVTQGQRWISATATGNVDIVICDPDGKKISEGAPGKSVSTPDKPEGYAPAVDYTLFVRSKGANTTWSVEVIVHWEPKPE